MSPSPSRHNGAHGWANGVYYQQQAIDGALDNCRIAGGKQCGIDAWSHNQCAAVAAIGPAATGSNGKWGAHHGTWGATIEDATAKAQNLNGGGETIVDRCATGDSGWG